MHHCNNHLAAGITINAEARMGLNRRDDSIELRLLGEASSHLKELNRTHQFETALVIAATMGTAANSNVKAWKENDINE